MPSFMIQLPCKVPVTGCLHEHLRPFFRRVNPVRDFCPNPAGLRSVRVCHHARKPFPFNCQSKTEMSQDRANQTARFRSEAAFFRRPKSLSKQPIDVLLLGKRFDWVTLRGLDAPFMAVAGGQNRTAITSKTTDFKGSSGSR